MALASRFATAKFLGSTPAPNGKGFALGKPSAGGGLLAQALGPQAVGTPGAPTVTNPTVGGPSVLPPDASYEQQVGLLGKQHDIDTAGLQQAKQQALLQYGYTQDASGNLAFDPSNPFSQAAMLKRSYDQGQAGNTNSYAARGQLYSGALQNAQNETGFQYQKSNNTLSNALQAFLAQNTGGLAQADLNYQSGLSGAASTRVQNAANNPLYQPSAVPDAAPAAPLQDTNAVAGGPKSIPWKDSAGRPGVLHIWPDGHRVFVRS